MFENDLLPPRCIKCNRPTSSPPVRLKLSYVDPDIAKQYRPYRYIPIVGMLARLMQASAERRSRQFATIHVSLCRTHRARPWIIRGVQVVSIIAALGLFYTATQTWTQEPAVAAAIAIVIAITATLLAKPPLTILQMSNGHLTLKGAGPVFLATLPQE